MAIAFRSASSFATTLPTDTSLTGAAPAGTTAGDVLIAFINMDGGSGQTITPPTGWTLIRRTNDGTTQAVASYWALDTVSAFNWSYSSGSHATLHILTISGADTVSADPIDIDGGQANAASTSVTAPSVTTTSPNTLLCFFGGQSEDATYTPPSGMTERTDQAANLVSSPVSGETATVVLSAAGATGTKVATSTVSAVSVGQLVAVTQLTEARVSQVAAETLLQATGSGLSARVSQVAAETLLQATGSILEARVSQIAAEVLRETYHAVSTTFSAAASLAVGTVDIAFTAAASLRTLHVDTTFTAAASLLLPTDITFSATVAISTIDTSIPPVYSPDHEISIGAEWHYQLRVVNYDDQYVGSFDRAIAFDYTLVVNDVGVLNLTLPGDTPYELLRPDYRIEVWRGVGNDKPRLEGNTQFFIQIVVEDVQDDGSSIIQVTAYSLNHILARRVAAYSTEDSYGYQIDNEADVMKAIVRQNFGTLATDTTRNITQLTIDPDDGYGAAIEVDVAYKYVLEVLKDIANNALASGTPLFFEVVASAPPGAVAFRVYTTARGRDRRQSSNNALIISRGSGVLGAHRVTTDYSTEANVVYALGAGEGALQLTSPLIDLSRTQRGPFARREAVYNNQQADTLEALELEGNAMLIASRPRKLFEGRVLDTPKSIYGRDWGYGDYLTAETATELFDCFVVAVHVAVNDAEQHIDAVIRNDS